MIAGCFFVCGALLTLTGPVLHKCPERGHADDPLVHSLLLRLGRRQRRLPARKRDLPDGNPRDGDSPLLLHSHGDWGHLGASSVRQYNSTGNAASLFVAYLVGAGFMIFAAVVELILGVRAEGKSLENIATPLTAIEEATGKSAASSAT
jgi:hypothetical protein